MQPSLFLVPVVSALAGWLINWLVGRYFFYNYLPARKEQLSRAIAAKINDALPFAALEQKISDPQLIESAMPMIEGHIDEFLNKKLPEEIPMLAMFVGNKTTDKIREVFITQLKNLFPKVMEKLAANFKSGPGFSAPIEQALQQADWQAAFKKQFSGAVLKISLLGLLAGLAIGALNLWLFYALT
ncbi:hypothetical protein ABDK00_008230 [Niabella insulamsoli]|uniref:hypothetical protein n=1 Tax=Niabella insulamsoli TaxID=3144874 RepID=UPI0031FBDAB9